MRAAWFALAIACSGGIFSSLAPLPGKGFNCPGKGRTLGTSTTATGFGGSGSGSALWKVRSSYGASSPSGQGLVLQGPDLIVDLLQGSRRSQDVLAIRS